MADQQADLMGTAEVAACLGVTRQRVLQLLRDVEGFPRPVASLSMGHIWDGNEIRLWATARQKR